MTDQTERWCRNIVSLQKIGDGHWSVCDASRVSFPVDGQAELASIEESSYWFRHRNKVISSLVTRFPPPGMIVDVGGGNGFVSTALIENGFPSMVIEPGAIGASKCVERGVPVVQAAFQDIEVAPSSTAAIGLFDVLEHIDDDLGALRRLQESLQPGGRMYLTVPAYRWLWSIEDVEAGHFRRYTLRELRSKFEASGLAVEFETYFFSPLVAPLLFLRTIPTKIGARKEMNIKRNAKEHSLPDNAVGRFLSRALAKEHQKIATGQAVGFGTSCFIAARKL